MKRIFKLLPVFLLVMAVSLGQCFAASSTYGYSITIFSGNQGAFKGDVKKVQISGNYNDRIALDIDDLGMELNNEKYFVKGLRETGKDNNETTVIRSKIITLTEDMSFVVAYGLKKDMVKYTVKYEDKNGKELSPEKSYYGSVGDKPVVAYKYIDGYVPDAYNATKTLVENEKENVFVFHYSKAAQEEQVAGQNDSGDKNVSDNGNNDNDKASGKNSGKQSSDTKIGKDKNSRSAAAVSSNANQDAANQARTIDTTYRDGNGNGGNDGAGDSNDSEKNSKPKEIKDLDDNEVPLASGNNNDKDKGIAGFFAHHQIAILSAAAVAVLGALIVLLKRRKKSNAEE